jgi:PPOX class probable FMN-dependent enzyme
MARIDSLTDLRSRYVAPLERTVRKELDHLDRHCRSFIAHAPFLVLATSGGGGRLDVSPRGDAPGFVQVADERTLLIPDRPGNNRLDSFTNLIENPRAAAILMIPGVDETLRVSGSAELRDDGEMRRRFAAGDRLPTLVVVLTVEQAYLHCAKAFMRSSLWDPTTWPSERPIPTMGVMIHDQINEERPAETQEAMLARYRESLY